MKITARFHGILADWVGTPSAGFELPANAAYADLVKEIGRRYKQYMPEQLWDQKNNTFNAKVRPFRDGKSLNAMDSFLREGDEITFLLMMAGG